MKLKTKLIHAGIDGDPHTGAVVPPIYQVSTFEQDGIGQNKGYAYSRANNPTREAVETYIAEIEGGVRGFAFSSGMAALSTVLLLFGHGDHVICGDDMYGGTYRVVTQVFSRFGLEVSFVDAGDVAKIEAAVQKNTKAVLLETPSNPLMKVADIGKTAEFTRSNGLLLIVDNTFLTPYWQNPLALGADIVYHSASKYLGGHSDLIAGLVVVKDEEIGERLHFLQKSVGSVLGPQEAWLLLRGMKTLGVRMEEHEANARVIADWLRRRPDVLKVHHPGLPDHPGHQIAKSQARGFGATFSFEVESAAKAESVLQNVRLFKNAISLGSVESLITIPAHMTHASIPPERRAQLGITDRLIRVSVGLEDVGDLIEDLEQALS